MIATDDHSLSLYLGESVSWTSVIELWWDGASCDYYCVPTKGRILLGS